MMFLNRLYFFSFVFLNLLFLHGCATNPVTGNREITLISVAQEKKLGAESAKEIEQSMGLLNDPALVKYVQKIGNKLAKFSPYQEVDYHFQVVNVEQPNAFALPGGYVYVSRGLLVLTNSEAELAGVIGHEIGHVAARHSVQRMTRSAPIGLVTGITSMATGLVSSSLSGAVAKTGSAINSAVLAPYSRSQENDADAIGQQLAAKAGWNPDGITLFLKTLDREKALHQQDEQGFDILSTHPSTPERIQATEQRITQLKQSPANPVAKNKAAFLNHLNGLKVGIDASLGVFQKQKFLHPQYHFALTFPKQWKTQNAPQYVAAVSANEDAALILQSQGPGTNPVQAAQQYFKEQKMPDVVVKEIRINGLPAARAELSSSNQEAILTWITLNKQLYTLIGLNTISKDDYRKKILASIASFHTLTAKEKKSITQTRLRIISARQGESLAKLLKRSASSWDVQTCAVANNLHANSTLNKGQLIKVAITEAMH